MLKKFALATTLGTVFVSYVLAAGVIGYYLDKWLGTNPWFFLIFFFIGTGGAIYHIFLLAAKLNS